MAGNPGIHKKPLNVYLYIPNIIVSVLDLLGLRFIIANDRSRNAKVTSSNFCLNSDKGTITGHQASRCYGMTEFSGICNPIGGKQQRESFGNDGFFKTDGYYIILGWTDADTLKVNSAFLFMERMIFSGLALPVCWLFFRRPGLVFLSLLALDISSHCTFLVGKTSHKDVKDSSSWLFRLYYGNRMFMGYCCVSCEVLYITLFLLARKETGKVLLMFL
ncbi:CDP-diacylglycerol-inositol 3-phosphatidyltransferase [Datura stramonium]|uniref:CDP-diacylglycerol-inositol 3-phosphatidyltransferase n=1 Tax=Datura stramonium TaxID=4076 RepID=A0ABS8RHS2_DATST|nr:CDP-diacylglycerol-inositol 3-phosphatidyltransferase [Datura stramonium]